MGQVAKKLGSQLQPWTSWMGPTDREILPGIPAALILAFHEDFGGSPARSAAPQTAMTAGLVAPALETDPNRHRTQPR